MILTYNILFMDDKCNPLSVLDFKPMAKVLWV